MFTAAPKQRKILYLIHRMSMPASLSIDLIPNNLPLSSQLSEYFTFAPYRAAQKYNNRSYHFVLYIFIKTGLVFASTYELVHSN